MFYAVCWQVTKGARGPRKPSVCLCICVWPLVLAGVSGSRIDFKVCARRAEPRIRALSEAVGIGQWKHTLAGAFQGSHPCAQYEERKGSGLVLRLMLRRRSTREWHAESGCGRHTVPWQRPGVVSLFYYFPKPHLTPKILVDDIRDYFYSFILVGDHLCGCFHA